MHHFCGVDGFEILPSILSDGYVGAAGSAAAVEAEGPHTPPPLSRANLGRSRPYPPPFGPRCYHTIPRKKLEPSRGAGYCKNTKRILKCCVWSRRVPSSHPSLGFCFLSFFEEVYNKTPSHNTGHGTGAHWH